MSGLEGIAVVRVGGDRQRAHRAPREAVVEGHEAGATADALGEPVAAGELQARFDRLGAAVAEEGPLQSREAASRAATWPCSGWK